MNLELSIRAMWEHREISEGIVDLEVFKTLDDKTKKQIADTKASWDRAWDAMYVPMGKDGSSQRKEYEKRGKHFKAMDAELKKLLKKHKALGK